MSRSLPSIAASFLAALSLFAQDPRMLLTVRGEIRGGEPLIGNGLVVNLSEEGTHRVRDRTLVSGDGGFEFRNIPSGRYSVSVVRQNGDVVYEESVDLRQASNRIDIRLPDSGNRPRTVAGTVSLRQLQYRPSAKSMKALAKAHRYTEEGNYPKAIEELRRTLDDPGAAPFARSAIGIAYVKAGQPAAAVAEFEESLRLIPDEPVSRTNLSYALAQTGRIDEAETEARRALQLDKTNAKARLMMGRILLAKGSNLDEAVEHLKFASREIPRVRVTLAEYYERTGQKEAAVHELREFLPATTGEDRIKVERWLSKLSGK